MRNNIAAWSCFAVLMLVGLAAMGWVSHTALALEAAEAQARRQADTEEKIRLALWRMESVLAPLVAVESSRPLEDYEALREVTAVAQDGAEPGQFLAPSPLLAGSSPYINLYFRIDPSGVLSSPQIPEADHREVAAQITSERFPEESLERLRALTGQSFVAARLPDPEEKPPAFAALAAMPEEAQSLMQQMARPARILADNAGTQIELNRNEYGARANQSIANYANKINIPIIGKPFHPPPGDQGPERDTEGIAKAVWLGDELLLARRIRRAQGEYVVGCWFDRAALQAWLAETVQDLLPGATLHPAGGAEPAGRTLATLPLRLEPGPVTATKFVSGGGMAPVLVVAWTCLILALAAFAALLAGLIALGERRRTFVSSVTHELRTPLTTFRLYTEMLLAGMVRDPVQQREYLATLHAEAERLTHLVENVLAYARVERGRKPANLRRLSLEETLEGMRARLVRRASEAGMELVLDATADHVVMADSGCLEQILFNLVDNACKYAAPATQPRIEIAVKPSPRGILLTVRDFGPGIGVDQAGRLFRPFGKSAEQAATTAPGIGLGLELSRRLARAMGGDLQLDRGVADGACFVLQLRTP